AKLRLHLGVEDLPGELARLAQDHAAILGGGVVAEVGPLVHEAPAVRVDVDAPGVGMLLALVADREIAELRGVALPGHRVAAGPVAHRGGADVERHANDLARVEARAAHLGELPAGAEVAGPHLRIGLEATSGQDDGFAFDVLRLALMANANTVNPVVVGEQRNGAGAVPDLDAVLARDGRQVLDEARAAAHGLHREAAPELEAPADFERLPAPGRGEAQALLAHPHHGLQAFLYQDFRQIGVAAVFGNARHVVEELVLRIGTEVGALDLFPREVGDHLLQVLDAVVGDAEKPRGEARVAARLVLGRALEDQDTLARKSV